MPLYTKNRLFILFFIVLTGISAQQKTDSLSSDYIHILYADHATTSDKYPGKQLLAGEVKISHNGALLFCDKAIVDKAENSAIAVGNVRLTQGDTVRMNAGYLKYDGNKSFAEAYDKVYLEDTKMHLTTDTLYFDRTKQEAYYTSGGTIVDSVNTLKSKIGKYFFNEKRFRFINNVHIDNPDYQLDSYQLDYFTDTGISNFFGPTKIYNNESYIYAEKGHYDSQKKVSWFVKNAFIKHRHTTIKGDSLFYNRLKEYATASDNVVLHDSVNKTWIFAGYAQRWIKPDSIRVKQKPLVVSVSEKDTLFIRAKQFVAAGKQDERRLWGYPEVRFFSKDFSGKSDSLYRNGATKLMKLLVKPVAWSGNSQITGERILLQNDSLNHLDSLIIPKDVFIIQKDSAGGYNQIKGKKLFGKFVKNRLKTVDIFGNTEIIYFLREDDGKLTGIEKDKSSHIYIEFENDEVKIIRLYDKPEGTVYPYKDFIKQKQYFSGFNWRGDEQIKRKEDIIGEQSLIYQAETKQQPTELPEIKLKSQIPVKRKAIQINE